MILADFVIYAAIMEAQLSTTNFSNKFISFIFQKTTEVYELN